jgi:hypothetical protein
MCAELLRNGRSQALRPSASAFLELRDALFEGLRDSRPAEPVDFP